MCLSVSRFIGICVLFAFFPLKATVILVKKTKQKKETEKCVCVCAEARKQDENQSESGYVRRSEKGKMV